MNVVVGPLTSSSKKGTSPARPFLIETSSPRWRTREHDRTPRLLLPPTIVRMEVLLPLPHENALSTTSSTLDDLPSHNSNNHSINNSTPMATGMDPLILCRQNRPWVVVDILIREDIIDNTPLDLLPLSPIKSLCDEVLRHDNTPCRTTSISLPHGINEHNYLRDNIQIPCLIRE